MAYSYNEKVRKLRLADLAKVGPEALSAGSRNAHWMFVTPNDDGYFTLYTVNQYTGPDPKFFQKLAPSRKLAAQVEKKDYDDDPWNLIAGYHAVR